MNDESLNEIKESISKILDVCYEYDPDTAISVLLTSLEVYLQTTFTETMLEFGEKVVDRQMELLLSCMDAGYENLKKSVDKSVIMGAIVSEGWK